MEPTRSVLAIALVFLAGCTTANAARMVLSSRRAQTHPIENVIALLDDLSSKAKKTLQEEEVAFAKFSTWAKTSAQTLSKGIADKTDLKTSLEEEIAGQKLTIEALSAEIEELTTKMQNLEVRAGNSDDMRGAAGKTYGETKADLEEAISAIEQAKDAVQKDGTAVITLQIAKLLPAEFVQTSRKGNLVGKPDATKYAGKSGSVVELLKKLAIDFKKKLRDVENAETNSLNSYDLEKQERDAQLKAAKESKEAKEDSAANSQGRMDDNKATLEDTNKDLTTYQTQLTDLTREADTKSDEYAERKQTQEREIEAIKQAKKILSTATGVATDAPANPALPSPPVVSLLQVASSLEPRLRAVELLRSTAQVTHSAALKRLAEHLALGGPTHFNEINNMIQKMIFRLKQEQKDEDEHKQWCDQEVEKTTTSKDNTEADKVALEQKIVELTANIQELEETTSEKVQRIADLDSFMSEATEARDLGRAENKRVIKEAKEAQTALTQATAVLEEFYKSSGAIVKAALLQAKAKGDDITLPETPATWGASYTGVQEKPEEGIIATLIQVSADFSDVEARTKAQDAEDQKQYDQDMQDAKIGKAQAKEEVTQLTTRTNRKSQAKQAAEGKKEKKADQLKAETQYIADLQKACVEGDSTYDERKANRSREIKGLDDALVILRDAFEQK